MIPALADGRPHRDLIHHRTPLVAFEHQAEPSRYIPGKPGNDGGRGAKGGALPEENVLL
jgi:hypothetical protein